MALVGILSTQVVINQGILDTNVVTSSVVNMDYLEESVIMAINTLDQAVTLSTQYSDDGGNTWTNIGTTYNLAAGSSVVANQYDQALTGIKLLAGLLRIVAQAGTAPTTGNLKVTFQGMSD